MGWYERFEESSINGMYKDISKAMEEAGINLGRKDVLIVGIGEGFELEKIPVVRDAFYNNKANFCAIDVEDCFRRDGVKFKKVDVRDISKNTFGKTFDVILLNNVIIYFSEDGTMRDKGYEDIEKTLENLYKILRERGYLVLTTEYEGKIMQEKDRTKKWRGMKRFISLYRLEEIINDVGFEILSKKETFIEGKKRKVNVFTFFPACPGMLGVVAYHDEEYDLKEWIEYERNEIMIYILRKAFKKTSLSQGYETDK